MTLSKRSDRGKAPDIGAILKSNRQSTFFALAGAAGFLALGSLLKYSDFQAGSGLIILIIVVVLMV